MSIGGPPFCIACHRPAAIFDRQLHVWVCEGNDDCGLSRNTSKARAQLEFEESIAEEKCKTNG